MVDYIYTAMWVISGLILVFKLRKENKIFLFAGISLISMGCWWGFNIYTKTMMNVNLLYDKPWVYVFRGYVAVIAIILCIGWYYIRKSEKPGQKTEKEQVLEQDHIEE